MLSSTSTHIELEWNCLNLHFKAASSKINFQRQLLPWTPCFKHLLPIFKFIHLWKAVTFYILFQKSMVYARQPCNRHEIGSSCYILVLLLMEPKFGGQISWNSQTLHVIFQVMLAQSGGFLLSVVQVVFSPNRAPSEIDSLLPAPPTKCFVNYPINIHDKGCDLGPITSNESRLSYYEYQY